MRTRAILLAQEHRSEPLPVTNWRFYQEWNKALFLHWKVNPEALRTFVPASLELDLIDGNAWVSLVLFDMQKIRPRNLPAVNVVSDFHEINLRTYVTRKGKAGVYFLSIEASKKAACLIAKKISGLPYRYASIKRQANSITSKNDALHQRLDVSFSVKEPLTHKSTTDLWLTERYALFQDHPGRLDSFDIHHIAWPLNAVELTNLQLDYNRFNPLLSGTPHAVHYSPGVQVIAWSARKER